MREASVAVTGARDRYDPRMTGPTADASHRVNDGLNARLLAESLRGLESSRPGSERPEWPIGAVGPASDDPERALISRAVVHAEALRLAASLRRFIRRSALLVLLMMLIPLVAGGVAARAAVTGTTANVFGLLGGLLGVQTAFLLLWAAVMASSRRAGGGVVGRTLIEFAMSVMRRVLRSDVDAASAQALGSVLAFPRVGRWMISLLTHAAWACFNLGAMAALAFMFLGEGYQFRWDSTWLSAESYARVIHWVGAGPDALGFPTPDASQIAASRTASAGPAAQDEPTRAAWSWLFFGSVVVYGLAPRLLLALSSGVLLRRSLRRYRLDLDHPYYMSLLRARHAPIAAPAPRGDETTTPSVAGRMSSSRNAPPGCAVGLLGFEITSDNWPPLREGLDLGRIDDRAQLTGALNRAKAQSGEVGRVLVFVELRTSPDRGVRGVLEHVATSLPRWEIWVVLSGGRAFNSRAGAEATERRVAGWRRIVRDAGLDADRVVELDLDHLTDVTRSRLRAMARGESINEVARRRLEGAFGLIQEAAEQWTPRVPWKAQVELLQRLDALYGCGAGRVGVSAWQASVDRLSRVRSVAEASEALTGAARQFAERLPPSLRLRPAWVAAGAVAGAVGCLAAALTLAPAAVGALPLWSGLGAAVAGAMSSLGRSGGAEATACDDHGASRGSAVRAAALYAMTLESQGRPESRISQVLERAIPADEPELEDVDSIRRWLDDVRHRFDLALVSEGVA